MIKLQMYAKFSDCKRGGLKIKKMKINYPALIKYSYSK